MTDTRDTRHRRSLRLKGYDYGQAGAYFVTLCAEGRQTLFGEIVGVEVCLNQYGQLVEEECLRTREIRQEASLDAFVVMPNHLHGILVIEAEPGDVDAGAHGRAPLPGGGPLYAFGSRRRGVGAHSRAPLPVPLHRAPRSLGSAVAGFKSAVTKRINAVRGTPGAPVWQRNYNEHVIRDEHELERAREYIVNNPCRWALDRENPAVGSDRPANLTKGHPVMRPGG